MEYREFLDSVQKLDFISDEPMGDAVVKAVMGILASSLEQGLAHALAESLPEPLTYERLRGHQARAVPVTADRYIQNIRRQFGLKVQQARQAILSYWM